MLANKSKLIYFVCHIAHACSSEILIRKRCFDAFLTIMIKSDGTVFSANGRFYNLTIGNLYTNNLKEVWNSNIIAHLRKTLINIGVSLEACLRCCSAFIK